MKALLFLALATALSAQTADTIYHNAKFVTVDGAFRIVSGLAVKGDRILAADDIAKLKPLAGPQTKPQTAFLSRCLRENTTMHQQLILC